jgi:hypothetical protein
VLGVSTLANWTWTGLLLTNFWNLETGKIVKELKPKRLYESMNITGVTGLTDA